MIHYIALVDQTPDIFGVVIPDCSGCYAAGHSLDEALTNAADALDEWLSDRLAAGFDLPKPRSIVELRGDASLAIDFAEGAMLAAVPTGIGEVHPGPELDARLMKQINEAAERSGISVAAFLAAAAREKIAVGR